MRFSAAFLVGVAAICLMIPAAAPAAIDDQINTIKTKIHQKESRVKLTQEQFESLKTNLDESISEYQDAQIKLQAVEDVVAKKQRELNSATEQQLFYQKILNNLSVFAYRDGDIYLLEVMLGTHSFKDLIARIDYLNKLSQRQSDILKAAKRLRKTVRKDRDLLATEKARQKAMVENVRINKDKIERLLAEQQSALNVLEKDIVTLKADKRKKEEEKKLELIRIEQEKKRNQFQKTIVAPNIQMTFPIPQPYAHSFINDWGFARAGNPSGHQANDIFGLKGTPLVAVTDGVISNQFGYLRIGGWRLHVVADNGVDFYYAHLNNDTPGTDDGQGGAATAYAPGIAPGVRVKQGQVIGYMGDSGDAEPTPAHVHFGITVNDQWVNPYPYLKASDWR